MSKETQRLTKALETHRQQHYLTSLQIATAATILRVNGIEAALAYVNNLPDGVPPMQAAFEFHLEELEQLPEEQDAAK